MAPTPKIPFILFGDALGQPTGLSRILTDLAVRTRQHLGDRLDVRVVGWGPWRDLPPHGVEMTYTVPRDPYRGLEVPMWGYGDFGTRGRYALAAAYRQWFGTTPGIVLTVWDAARVEVVQASDLPVTWWGYVPVDAENQHGKISGPALANLQAYDRLLGYGPYGSRVLTDSLKFAGELKLPWLPHGIDRAHTFTPFDPGIEPRVKQILGGASFPDTAILVGCVAANQRRKDLGVYCQVLAALRAQDPRVRGWLHTDKLIGDAWSIPQLVLDCGLEGVLTVTHTLTDQELAGLYRRCAVTIAPGRGEGFGYPILESIACGRPVIVGDYAGGADLVPDAWKAVPSGFQLEGVYAERRPVLDVREFTDATKNAMKFGARVAGTEDYTAWIRELATPYDWRTLWPKWQAWIEDGLASR
jgi:glycosyltransferase involved in cell wall biosynthesis